MRVLDSGAGPDSCLVALHGRGANAEDLTSLAGELNLPDLRWIFADGILPFAGLPGGREWFRMDDPGSPEFFQGLDLAREAVQTLVESLLRGGSAPRRLGMLGFSQGAALALEFSLFAKNPPACCAALSGVLARLPDNPPQATEFFLAHGRRDEVLPVDLGREAAAGLKALGAPVEFHEFDMGHEISVPELSALRAFLLRSLLGTKPSR